MTRIPKELREKLMLEYKELLEEILSRRENTWMIHSILIASTLIITFSAKADLLKLASFISIFLICISFFFQWSSTKINQSCWNRRHEIEETLEMKCPKRRYEELKGMRWFKIRRKMWYALFLFLIVIYMYICARDTFSELLLLIARAFKN